MAKNLVNENGMNVKMLKIKGISHDRDIGNEKKRTVLCDLANNAKRTEINKKGILRTNTLSTLTGKNNNYASTAIDLKNVKAKVSTYWKKDEAKKIQLPTTSTNNNKVKTVITSNAKATKVLTTKIPCSNNVKQQPSTTTNKILVTGKNQKTKIVVRREESKLTRKSLTKLDAFNRNSSDQDSNPKHPKHIKQTKPTENVEAKSEIEEKTKQETIEFDPIKEIQNIDLRDENNQVLLVPEYVNDIYAHLFSSELEYPIKENHLSNQIEINGRMRAILVDWLNTLHYQFGLLPETYHLTVDIVDRYLQEVSTTRKQKLQLIGITALLIATKFEDLYPPEIGDLIYMTDNTYIRQEVINMELKILQALDFRLCRPLSIHFLRRFSKIVEVTTIHHQASKYILELASINYEFSHYRPSQIAAASLFLSLILFDNLHPKITITYIEDLWTVTLSYYTKYSVHDLLSLVQKLSQLLAYAPLSKYNSVYNKYKSEKFYRVSERRELNVKTSLKLQQLINDN